MLAEHLESKTTMHKISSVSKYCTQCTVMSIILNSQIVIKISKSD